MEIIKLEIKYPPFPKQYKSKTEAKLLPENHIYQPFLKNQ